MVSIKDIAKEAGVTAATVSLALREHPRISKTRVTQIKELAEKMGYRPNMVARGLQKGKSKTIGYLASSLQLEVASREVVLLDELLLETGYKTYVSYTKGEMDLTLKTAKDLISHGVDGLILTGVRHDGNFDLNQFNFSVPTVFSRNHINLPFQSNNVKYDYYPAVKNALKELKALGHQHIFYFVTGWHGWQQSPRVKVFEQAMQEFNLPYKSNNTYLISQCRKRTSNNVVGIDQDDIIKNLEIFIEKHPECTAIFGSNDLTAMTVIRGLTQLGIRVPDDISVLGFDDIAAAAYYQPALSTIRQPAFDLVASALELLFKQINGTTNSYENKFVNAEFIKRESIAKVRVK